MIIAALLLGQTLPITPLQILWVNMVTTVTLAMGFEPPESNLMDRPPRSSGEPLLPFRLVARTAWGSLLLAGGRLHLPPPLQQALRHRAPARQKLAPGARGGSGDLPPGGGGKAHLQPLPEASY